MAVLFNHKEKLLNQRKVFEPKVNDLIDLRSFIADFPLITVANLESLKPSILRLSFEVQSTCWKLSHTV